MWRNVQTKRSECMNVYIEGDRSGSSALETAAVIQVRPFMV